MGPRDVANNVTNFLFRNPSSHSDAILFASFENRSYENTGLISRNAARRQGTRSRSRAFPSCLEAKVLTILAQPSLKRDEHLLSKYGKLSYDGLLSQKPQVIGMYSATMATD